MISGIVDFSPEGLKKLKEAVNTDICPVKYLAIDPGGSNGICGYDEKYYLQFMYTIPATEMVKFLYCFEKVELCVLENFILFPGTGKRRKRRVPEFSDMETSRVIGRVEVWAEQKDVILKKQPSSIKPDGYAWIGEKPLPKSNPNNHTLDAHVHFMYWAILNSKIDAAAVLKRSKFTIGGG